MHAAESEFSGFDAKPKSKPSAKIKKNFFQELSSTIF
jgi:hypothetical protein